MLTQTGALIVTHGATNLKKQSAPFEKVGEITSVKRLVYTLKRSGVSEIVLVYNQDSAEYKRELSRLGISFIYNNDEKSQMLDNIKIGLEYFKNKVKQVLITPVDIPLVNLETIEELAKAGSPLAVPAYLDKTGHPLLLSSDLFESIISYTGGDGLRGAVRNSGVERKIVPVDDPGIHVRTDNLPKDSSLIKAHTLSQIHPVLKLELAKEETFYGPGTQQLLMLIDDLGSVRNACNQMGISYSKGWSIIHLMEDYLDFNVVERQQGGKSGGEAWLSDKGKELSERYRLFVQDSTDAIEAIFLEYFEKYINQEEN